MTVLLPRQSASHFAAHNVQQDLKNPWGKCMAHSYCKWPVIIGIVIASVVIISIIFCCVRCLCCGLSCCCDCLSCFRPRRRNRANTPSTFMPAPYQGYQPANSPHGYQPPSQFPQFAQFDASRKGGKVHEDSLPAMPGWDTASERKVLDESHEEEVEMGKLDPQKAPMLANQAPPPRASAQHPPAVGLPYQQHGAAQGGDLGNPYGQTSPGYGGPYGQSPQGYGEQQGYTSPTAPQQYHSPDDLTAQHGLPAQQAYSGYAPSESTRYEPSTAYGGQETGTGYHSQTQYGSHTPGVLQAGHQPVPGSFRDV